MATPTTVFPFLPLRSSADSHGLDRGRPAGTLVVHALTWLCNEPFPQDAADWRRVWADAGVACDDLSCDVLVLIFPGFAMEPLRLTLRQVMSWQPPTLPRGVVFSCENPAVVAAAADRLSDASPPLVCVDGMPSTAALMVLPDSPSMGTRSAITVTSTGGASRSPACWRAVRPRGRGGSRPGYVERAVRRGLGAVALSGIATTSPWDSVWPLRWSPHGSSGL